VSELPSSVFFFLASKLNQQALQPHTSLIKQGVEGEGGDTNVADAKQLKENAACRLHVPQTNRMNRSNSQHSTQVLPVESEREGRERGQGVGVG